MTLDAFSTSGQKSSRDHINILLKPNKGMASYFIRRVEEGISEGHRVFKIKFPDKAALLFPNYCVPLAGAIDYYRASRNCVFLPSRSTSGNSPAGKIGLLEPFTDLPDSTTGPSLIKSGSLTRAITTNLFRVSSRRFVGRSSSGVVFSAASSYVLTKLPTIFFFTQVAKMIALSLAT